MQWGQDRQPVGSVAGIRGGGGYYSTTGRTRKLSNDDVILGFLLIGIESALGQHQTQRIFFVLDWLIEFLQLASRIGCVGALGKMGLHRGEGLRRGIFLTFLLECHRQLVQRLGRDRRVGILLHQLGQAGFGGAEVRAVVVILADYLLVAREHLAAYLDPILGELGELALRITALEILELGQSVLGIALILVRTMNLIEVGHPHVIGCQRQILVGRMHPLEIRERINRFGVFALLIQRKRDLQLGIFGVGTKRKLIDDVLIIIDGSVVVLALEHRLGLSVEILARG